MKTPEGRLIPNTTSVAKQRRIARLLVEHGPENVFCCPMCGRVEVDSDDGPPVWPLIADKCTRKDCTDSDALPLSELLP